MDSSLSHMDYMRIARQKWKLLTYKVFHVVEKSILQTQQKKYKRKLLNGTLGKPKSFKAKSYTKSNTSMLPNNIMRRCTKYKKRKTDM